MGRPFGYKQLMLGYKQQMLPPNGGCKHAGSGAAALCVLDLATAPSPGRTRRARPGQDSSPTKLQKRVEVSNRETTAGERGARKAGTGLPTEKLGPCFHFKMKEARNVRRRNRSWVAEDRFISFID